MKNKNKETENKLDKLEHGVTENAPYEDIAEYKMVTYLVDDTINTQGS